MSVELAIKLTRISPSEHTFEYTRDNGEKVVLTLKTKDFLFHDLLHYAVEMEAGLARSFYGLLAEGYDYTDLTTEKPSPDLSELALTERIVGPMTSVIQQKVTIDDFLDVLSTTFAAHSEALPSWFTKKFILNVQERMRRLLGQWNATSFGLPMEIQFQLHDL